MMAGVNSSSTCVILIEASTAEWLRRLIFYHFGLTHVAVGLNSGHDNMWDSSRACPDMILAFEKAIPNHLHRM